MTLSTPVKAASGLAVASTSVAGSALTYKYMTAVSLFQIEETAIDTKTPWIMSDISESEINNAGDNRKIISFLVKASSGSEPNLWSCQLRMMAIQDTTKPEVDKEQIKKELGEYFKDTVFSTNSATTSTKAPTEELIRRGFVTSCARNRDNKPHESSDTRVEAKLRVLLKQDKKDKKYKLDVEDLKTIFEGGWDESKQAEDPIVTNTQTLENQ